MLILNFTTALFALIEHIFLIKHSFFSYQIFLIKIFIWLCLLSYFFFVMLTFDLKFEREYYETTSIYLKLHIIIAYYFFLITYYQFQTAKNFFDKYCGHFKCIVLFFKLRTRYFLIRKYNYSVYKIK
jgi:hypothetical protein